MINLAEGLAIFFDTINHNLRHQDYERTKKIAEDFTIYATGHNVELKLKRFNGRETEEAFNQRVILTQVNIPDIFHSCIKPMAKVGRAPATIHTEWKGKEKKQSNELREQLFLAGKNFWGDKDVARYVAQRMVDNDSMDPNSFVIVEFTGVVDPAKPETKAKPYPFEANSTEAINYIYKNNVLQWLVVRNDALMVDAKGKEHAAEKLYLYIDNEAVTATQIHKDTIEQAVADGAIRIDGSEQLFKPLTTYLFTSNEKTESKKRYYLVTITEHKIGFVPARRFGTVLDPITRNRTCMPLVFAAQSYFEKSIKTMSEFDLTNCLHVFPQKILYADPCPGEQINDTLIGCERGYRPDGRQICGACKGSGFKEHTSAQDVIRLRMPKDPKDLVSLENLLVYKHPPIDLLEFQKKFGFVELRAAAQSAVYNSDVFSKQEVAQTATEKSIDLDAVYDTLMPFAESWSSMFVHIFKCIAALRDIGVEDSKPSDFIITHEFPKDFKMQSLNALLDDLQKATANGAPSHIKKAISRDITRKIYADAPHEALKVETKDKYFPFPGKSESEINSIITNGLSTKYLSTLYALFDIIFQDIEFETKAKELDFYQMDEKLQRDLIKEKVGFYMSELEKEKEAAMAEAFKAGEETLDSEEEEIEEEPIGN